MAAVYGHGLLPGQSSQWRVHDWQSVVSRLHLEIGQWQTSRVEAKNNSATNVYIQSATLDGKPLDIPVITWEQIQSGATLHL